MQQIGLWACDGSGKKGGIALARQGRTVRLVVGLAVSATVILGLVHCDLYGGAGFDSEFCAKVKGEAVKGFSCDDFASALKYVDDQGMVDYKGLKSNRARLDGFCRLVADLKTDEFDKWNRQEQIAVWTNVYNAVTLKAIIDNYPIKAGLLRSLAYPKNSIRQLPGVWDKWQFLVMGKRMTLNQVEHEVLRKQFKEPRIHVALVCAAMGCPPLRNEPYTGKKLDRQLDDQTRKFLSNGSKFRIDKTARKVYLSKIFQWFGQDFVESYTPAEGFGGHSESERAVLDFVSKYVPDEEADYLRSDKYETSYLDYDWALNEQKPRKVSDKE